LIFLLLSAFLFSCNSAQKELQRGNYEMAFTRSLKKLQKDPNDPEQAEIFIISYKKANQTDIDRIEYLKLSNDDNSLDEIFRIYDRLNRRQQRAETVLPLRAGGKTYDFEHINYNQKLVEAKKNAAYAHYRRGVELLKIGDKLSARKAYFEFQAVRKYYANYEDIDRLQLEAKEKGTTNVLLTPINKTYAQLPPQFLADLVDYSMQDLDDDWIRYYNTPQKKYYDYTVFISIVSSYISPDNMEKEKEKVSKKVKDGFQYVLDANGNVMKDSLGNDIKIDKYKTISCTITRKIQDKSAKIEARVEYQDNKTKRIIKTVPVSGSYKFHYVSAMANGDLNALDEATRKNIGQTPKAFPTNEEMLKYVGIDLKNEIKQVLISNKKYIK
jgi:hypothetical protein